jgi:hypothetical protein
MPKYPLAMEVKAPRRKLTEVKRPRAISHPVPHETRTKISTPKQMQNQKQTRYSAARKDSAPS